MKGFKRKIQIGFIFVLSLLFVQCEEIAELLAEEIIEYGLNDLLNVTHTYDITFTKGDETIHYSGSIKQDKPPSEYIKDAKGFPAGSEVVTLLLEDKDKSLKISSQLLLKENGQPVSFDQDAYSKGLGSVIDVSDSKKNNAFNVISGTVNLSNYKLQKVSDSDKNFASYILEFEGEFDLQDSKKGEPIRYSGKGKLVINPMKKI